MAFRSPLEPLLVRRSAPDLVFYDTKRGGDFPGGGAARRGEARREDGVGPRKTTNTLQDS